MSGVLLFLIQICEEMSFDFEKISSYFSITTPHIAVSLQESLLNF